MAKRDSLKRSAVITSAGGVAGALHGGRTSDMGTKTELVPGLIQNVEGGAPLSGMVEQVTPGSQTLAEGMAHIATSTGYGVLGAAAIAGGVHLGLKAYDAVKKNRNLGRQFD